jgi:hypothetical protein
MIPVAKSVAPLQRAEQLRKEFVAQHTRAVNR